MASSGTSSRVGTLKQEVRKRQDIEMRVFASQISAMKAVSSRYKREMKPYEARKPKRDVLMEELELITKPGQQRHQLHTTEAAQVLRSYRASSAADEVRIRREQPEDEPSEDEEDEAPCCSKQPKELIFLVPPCG